MRMSLSPHMRMCEFFFKKSMKSGGTRRRWRTFLNMLRLCYKSPPFEDAVRGLPRLLSVVSFSVVHGGTVICDKIRRFPGLCQTFPNLSVFYYHGRFNAAVHADLVTSLPKLRRLTLLEICPIFYDNLGDNYDQWFNGEKIDKCHRPFDLVHTLDRDGNPAQSRCKKQICNHFDCLREPFVHSPFLGRVRTLVKRLPHIKVLNLIINVDPRSCAVRSDYPSPIRDLHDFMTSRKASCVVIPPRNAFFV
jgi:hypothetical protein